MSEERNTTNSNSVDKIPQWFIPFVGFVYATGYLIVFRFLNRFGLRDTSGDLFKAKYIYVGLMYLAFAGVPITLFYIFLFIGRLKQEKKITERSGIFADLTPTIILFLNLVLILAILVLFAPPGFATQRQNVIPLIFLITLLGPIVIQLLTLNFIKETFSQKFANGAIWICLFTLICLDWYALYGLFKFLFEVLLGGAYFLILVYLIGLLIWRTYILSVNKQNRREQTPLLLFGLCIIILLYVFSVLTFAVRIYPYISVNNGGGDYSYTSTVILCFGEDNKSSIPREILEGNLNGSLCSKSLILIEETAVSIFVADPNSAGGPAQWRRGKGPKVIELHRDKVESVIYQ